jgi:membrane protein implicated in regulation of membrane protease activity
MLPYFFLASFVAGLVLGVHVMMHGVERVQSALPVRPSADGRYPASAARPVLAGFLTVFGFLGYVAHRHRDGLWPAGLLASVAGGLVGAWIGNIVVKRWAIPAAIADQPDERFVLMGHLGRVTAPIGDDAGTIAYEVDGVRHVERARALDGTAIAAGTDVVIERIEDGIAWVEPWSQVEQRI